MSWMAALTPAKISMPLIAGFWTLAVNSILSLPLVTATPATGYAFSSWSGACTGSGACSVTMDAAKSVGAEFKLNTTIPRLANISTRMAAQVRRVHAQEGQHVEAGALLVERVREILTRRAAGNRLEAMR